jgi:hypothetical protein
VLVFFNSIGELCLPGLLGRGRKVLVFFCTFANACCPGLLGRGSKSARFFLHLAVYSASIFDLQMPFQPKGFFMRKACSC